MSDPFPHHPKPPSGYTFRVEPVYVGYLCITSNLKIAQLVKPAQEHLDNMRATFGWTWEDIPKEPT